jgi:hypothetical protein
MCVNRVRQIYLDTDNRNFLATFSDWVLDFGDLFVRHGSRFKKEIQDNSY